MFGAKTFSSQFRNTVTSAQVADCDHAYRRASPEKYGRQCVHEAICDRSGEQISPISVTLRGASLLTKEGEETNSRGQSLDPCMRATKGEAKELFPTLVLRTSASSLRTPSPTKRYCKPASRGTLPAQKRALEELLYRGQKRTNCSPQPTEERQAYSSKGASPLVLRRAENRRPMSGTRDVVCLPNLPGYKARTPLEPGDKRHFKKTTLTYLKGYAVDEAPVYADVESSSEPRESSPSRGSSTSLQSKAMLSSTAGRPKWVENDKKVLRWFGYFKEAVPESPVENHRVRKLVICYYLADDTTEVLEPKLANSGLWQGAFIKRHSIAKADGKPLTATDIQVGSNLTLYGHVIRIIDADPFTRSHLAGLGISVPQAEACPSDPYQAKLDAAAKKAKEGTQPGNNQPGNALNQQGRLQAYILNSKKVLRFYCIWDDRQALYGDRRPFRLHHYLEDGTTEILEVYEANSGRDRFPVFLNRCLLPKDPELVKEGRIQDKRLCFGLEDFRIGDFVHIYGRDFFIHDCDDFTRQWYQDNMGCSPEMMAPVDVREPVPKTRVNTLPPYNGYGSLQDSAENCQHLIPRPPKKDVYKIINKSRVVLRFGARLCATASYSVPEDHKEREFVVSYFMADDSISVFEQRRDGFAGGKFLERRPIPKKGAPQGENLSDKDTFVGATLVLHQHVFELYSADEYTLQYMENNRQEYKMANSDLAIAEAKEWIVRDEGDSIRSALVEVDSRASGELTVAELASVMRTAGVPLVMHQVISIHRRLSRSSGGSEVAITALLQALGI